MIPSTLSQRERHVLLSLVLDDLGNLGGVDWGKLYELRENLITRSGDIRLTGDKSTLGQKLGQGTLQDSIPGGIL